MFDQLIFDINRDIHYFDRVAPAQMSSNDNQVEHNPSHHIGPHTPSTSLLNQQPTEPIHSGPLKDITNIPSAGPQLNSNSDKKWVRMHRPNLSPNDEPLETSLGKRGSLPSLENSKPLKHLATRDNVLPTPSPPMAVAG